MINNTWAWATAKGLVYKHPINQAEYVDLDVDSMKSTTKLTKSDLRLQAAATVKDPTNIYAHVAFSSVYIPAYVFLHIVHLHSPYIYIYYSHQ